MISSFQLKQHQIDKILVQSTNRDLDGHQLRLDYFANYRLEDDETLWSGVVALGFRYSFMEEQDRFDLFEIVIIGQFTMEKNDACMTSDDFIKRLKINGASTLIPIARAVLQATASMTERSEYHRLPNINVYELAWNASAE